MRRQDLNAPYLYYRTKLNKVYKTFGYHCAPAFA